MHPIPCCVLWAHHVAPSASRHPELSTTPHPSAAEEGRQCLVKAGSPQYKPNHSGCVLSVMQSPSSFGHHHQTQPGSSSPEKSPLGQAMDKDKLLTENDTSFKGTPMHNTTPLNTPFNRTVGRLQAAQWLARQSLAVPYSIISCHGHGTGGLQPAASCWNTSAKTAAGIAPPSQGRESHLDLQGKQLLSSTRAILPFPWPVSPPAAAEDGGSGIYFIFCRPREKEDFRGI